MRILIEITSRFSGTAGMLAGVNRTLIDLRARLGSPVRFHIDAEPGRKRRPVVAHVRWACGCHATGPGFGRLALAACAVHRPSEAERCGPMRVLPFIGALLSRS